MDIAAARTLVARLLNDKANNRYGVADDIDPALRANLNGTLGWYCNQGGLLFSEEVTGTTASAGTLDVDTYDPLHIHFVSYSQNSGERLVPLQYQEQWSVQRYRQEARDLVLRLTRQPDTTWTTGTDEFIGSTAGVTTAHKSTFDAFERLVCYRTALELGAADEKAMRAHRAQENRFMEMVRQQLAIAGSHSFAEHYPIDGRHGWTYKPEDQVIHLTARRR